jgi:hypothetical protein
MRVSCFVLACLLAGFAQAQEISFDAPSASRVEIEKNTQDNEQSQRIFGLIPMFDVTSQKHVPPLAASQKFRLFVKGTFDPFELLITGMGAGIAQANNDFAEYGQGGAGYGKRYGAALADSVSSGFFGGFLYPVLLKHDPRYFRRSEGKVAHRIGYALAQEFVCHTDNGGRSINFSKLLGAITASGISNAYYPPNDRGAGHTVNRAGFAMANGSIGNLLDEFWPDIRLKIFHKKD